MNIKGNVTYRKIINQGYTPVWYKTSHGSIAAFIISRGRKWMKVGLTNGQVKRVKMTEERYMTAWANKQGGVA